MIFLRNLKQNRPVRGILLFRRWPFLFPPERGKQCPWIAIRLPALLVEGIPQAPMNAEFHSAAARPMDASGHAQLTADRGLFLFMRIMKSRKIEAECGP